MSLLCVTVKKAHFINNAGQFNTYVTLKLQNVKSTTVTVKGSDPCWEQDFLFEINRMDVGLIVEVWHKGMLWDKFIGCAWIPLNTIQYSNEDGAGRWLSLDAEFVMKEGIVVGTHVPTGHSVLIDSRFELPYDMQDAETTELQKKLEVLNTIMDQEITNLKEQQSKRGICSAHSEDSDYTSDLSYPVTNAQHPNSSASQFRNATTNSLLGAASGSLEDPNSRQSSYELEDSFERQPSYENEEEMKRSDSESEPLYYNSRPHYQNRRDSWEDRDSPVADSRRTSISQQSTGTQEYYSEGERTSEQEHNYSDNRQNSQWNSSSIRSGGRRPSLERQKGIDQDHPPYYDEESPGEHYDQDDDRYDDNYDNYDDQYDDQYEDATDYGSVDRTEGQDSHQHEWYDGEEYDSYEHDRQSDHTATYEDDYDERYDDKYYDSYNRPTTTTTTTETYDNVYYENSPRDGTASYDNYHQDKYPSNYSYSNTYRDDRFSYQDHYQENVYPDNYRKQRKLPSEEHFKSRAEKNKYEDAYRYQDPCEESYDKTTNRYGYKDERYDTRRGANAQPEQYQNEVYDETLVPIMTRPEKKLPVIKEQPKYYESVEGVKPARRRSVAKHTEPVVPEIKVKDTTPFAHVDVVVDSWDRESSFYSAEEEPQWERPRLEVEPVKERRASRAGELPILEVTSAQRRPSQVELVVEEAVAVRRKSHAELDVSDVVASRRPSIRTELDVQEVPSRRPSRGELDVNDLPVRRPSRGDLADITAALPEVITTDDDMMQKAAMATFREVFVESKNEDFKDSFETSDYKDSFDTEYKDSFDTEYKESFDTEYRDSFETEEMASKDTDADITIDVGADINADIGIGVAEDAGVLATVEAKEGPRPTPKERWIKAFNQICSQLNVSTYLFILNV